MKFGPIPPRLDRISTDLQRTAKLLQEQIDSKEKAAKAKPPRR